MSRTLPLVPQIPKKRIPLLPVPRIPRNKSRIHLLGPRSHRRKSRILPVLTKKNSRIPLPVRRILKRKTSTRKTMMTSKNRKRRKSCSRRSPATIEKNDDFSVFLKNYVG